jgi:hypothetical protein
MAGTELKQSKDAPLSFFSFQDIIASVTALMVLITLVIALDPLGDELVTRRKAAGVDPMSQAARLEQASARVEAARSALAEARRALLERQSQPAVTADQVVRMDRLIGSERDGVAALERIASMGDAELRAAEDRQLLVQASIADAERERDRRRETAVDRVMQARVRAFEGPAEALRPLMIEVGGDSVVAGVLDDRRVPREKTRCPGTGESALTCIAGILGEHPADGWYALFVVRPDAVERFMQLREVMYGRGYEIGWQLWDGSASGFFERPDSGLVAPPGDDAAAPDAGGRADAGRVLREGPDWIPFGGAPVAPPMVMTAAVATVARGHRRGRKGGSIGTDPFGLFLDALCNTLGVIMLVLMCIMIFSKDGEGAADPASTEAEAVRTEQMAVSLEDELRGVLDALAKLPPSGEPGLIDRWRQLLAEGERLRTRRAALQDAIAATRASLEARARERVELERTLRAIEAQIAALVSAAPAPSDFIRLSRFRADARAPLLLAVAGGSVSAPAVAPGSQELAAPTTGMPLLTDADASAAVVQLVGSRTPRDVRIEVAVWSDSFGAYKKLERLLVERGYAINPLPVQVGKTLKAGVGGAQ